MQRTQLRIVAGKLRGRLLNCTVHAGLRPTPGMVREAYFSILGNAIPDRPFFDLFAGTGAFGLEAVSRGASEATFVERDFALAAAIEKHLKQFGIDRQGHVLRSDVYRWAERWLAPSGKPVNVFISPPYPDLTDRPDEFARFVATIWDKVADESVVCVQLDDGFGPGLLPDAVWDERHYGRNALFIAVKGDQPRVDDEPDGDESDEIA